MWVKNRKLFFLIFAALIVVALIVIYFYFRPPQTLADVVGRQFMNPDQIIILNGGNGGRRELMDNDRAEMLDLLRKAQIQKIEYIDIMDGAHCIQFYRGENRFTLQTHGEYCFRINDPDDGSQMIVYHVDKESWKKIRELMKLSY